MVNTQIKLGNERQMRYARIYIQKDIMSLCMYVVYM